MRALNVHCGAGVCRSAAQEWLAVISVLCVVGVVPVLAPLRQMHTALSLLALPVGLTFSLLVCAHFTWLMIIL